MSRRWFSCEEATIKPWDTAFIYDLGKGIADIRSIHIRA